MDDMTVGIGNVITVEQQEAFGGDLDSFRHFLRSTVYGMHCE